MRKNRQIVFNGSKQQPDIEKAPDFFKHTIPLLETVPDGSEMFGTLMFDRPTLRRDGTSHPINEIRGRLPTTIILTFDASWSSTLVDAV